MIFLSLFCLSSLFSNSLFFVFLHNFDIYHFLFSFLFSLFYLFLFSFIIAFFLYFLFINIYIFLSFPTHVVLSNPFPPNYLLILFFIYFNFSHLSASLSISLSSNLCCRFIKNCIVNYILVIILS